MSTQKKIKKIADRCTYVKSCYLAGELKCFGYKSDCLLYMKSNGTHCTEEEFDRAMNKLINKTLDKYNIS